MCFLPVFPSRPYPLPHPHSSPLPLPTSHSQCSQSTSVTRRLADIAVLTAACSILSEKRPKTPPPPSEHVETHSFQLPDDNFISAFVLGAATMHGHSAMSREGKCVKCTHLIYQDQHPLPLRHYNRLKETDLKDKASLGDQKCSRVKTVEYFQGGASQPKVNAREERWPLSLSSGVTEGGSLVLCFLEL